MENMKIESENRAIAEELRKAGRVELIAIDDTAAGGTGATIEVLSLTTSIHGERRIISVKPYLDEYRTRPDRRRGTARMTTLASFIDHVNRFRDDHTAIFAQTSDPMSPKLTAVLDYNELTAAGAPRFGQHRTSYLFPLSEEWKAWTGANNKMLEQSVFAEFLENRIQDILPLSEAGNRVKNFAQQLGINLASPQKILDLSRGLTIRVDSVVTNAQNLATGEGKLMYDEKHTDEAGAPITIPGGFALQIPFFQFGAAYQVPVRLRYRRNGAKIAWQMILSHVDLIWADAIKTECATVQEKTSCPIFFGSPEKSKTDQPVDE